MFENIGWAEILVLVVAGLFILGPERLPEAAAWLGKTIKQVRDYATGARDHLKKEMGPEFDQLQQPINDLRSLRSFNPRTAITRSLFDGDDPRTMFKDADPRTAFRDDDATAKPNGYAPGPNGAAANGAVANGAATNGAAANGAATNGAATNGASTAPADGTPPAAAPPAQPPRPTAERPPIDSDAT